LAASISIFRREARPGLTLATRNIEDFAAIDGLTLVNPSEL
jgi:predicted nucleic acid-binding protein